MKNITIHPEITMFYNLGYDSLGWRRKKMRNSYRKLLY